jgi:hypothetical protein
MLTEILTDFHLLQSTNSSAGLPTQMQLGLLSPLYLRRLFERLGATYIKLGQVSLDGFFFFFFQEFSLSVHPPPPPPPPQPEKKKKKKKKIVELYKSKIYFFKAEVKYFSYMTIKNAVKKKGCIPFL